MQTAQNDVSGLNLAVILLTDRAIYGDFEGILRRRPPLSVQLVAPAVCSVNILSTTPENSSKFSSQRYGTLAT
jgi:hypothetical protein